MKSLLKFFGLTALVVFAGASVCAAQDATAPAMTPEQQAQMAKAKENMTPGAPHQVLAPLAGNWNYTSKFWMTPDGKPEESNGTSTAEMIYGGRFLKETIKGTWMGEPFEGTGYTGYDNVKQEYVSVWVDGMATGLMTSAGQYDAASKQLTLSGSNSCPLTGQKDMKGRMVLSLADANSHKLEAYSPMGPAGAEMKTMEIVYTRS